MLKKDAQQVRLIVDQVQVHQDLKDSRIQQSQEFVFPSLVGCVEVFYMQSFPH